MPISYDSFLDGGTPKFYVSTNGLDYNPLAEAKFNLETLSLHNTERKENKMDIRDKICDKCGKRYSIADMRIERDGEYVDKTCYYANNTPLEDYPKLYHSRADKKNVGREMDLCPECAKELKKFTGEQ